MSKKIATDRLKNWSKACALILAVVGAVVAVGVPGSAHAQRKTISLDEIVIEGTIQKPEAFFILPRSSLNFEELARREDMKARIIKSVEKDPF